MSLFELLRTRIPMWTALLLNILTLILTIIIMLIPLAYFAHAKTTEASEPPPRLETTSTTTTSSTTTSILRLEVADETQRPRPPLNSTATLPHVQTVKASSLLPLCTRDLIEKNIICRKPMMPNICYPEKGEKCGSWLCK